VKRPPKGKMVLAALALLVGAASATVPRHGAGFPHPGEHVMKILAKCAS
jgi:hypothetical protein